MNDLEAWIEAGNLVLGGGRGGEVDVPEDFTVGFWDPELDKFHFQEFSEGRFVRWHVGTRPGGLPLVFAHTSRDIASLLSGELSGNAALGRLRVVSQDGVSIGPPPPLDRTTREAFQHVPSMTDVSSKVALHFDDAPFGSCDVAIVVREGRPELRLEPLIETDVWATLRFGSVLRYMAGDLTLMDMLKGARVEGDWPQLMLIAGIVESPEFQRALAPARLMYRHLGDVAEVFRSEWYRVGMLSTLAMDGA